MSIAEIGSEFKFIGAELVEHSNMRPLSDWKNGDQLKVVAHVNMQGSVNPLYWNARDLSFSTVREDLLESNSPQPKPWSGPEDGLPPVGISCERRFPSVTASSWQGGIILAHGSKKIFFRDNCGDEWAHSFDDVEFRAFRTTEQLAAEKRETAIREIMDVADVDCRVTAARLVDAGFKREVV